MSADSATNVGKEFLLLAQAGIVLMLVSALLYYLQSKEGMFDGMRPYVICANLVTLSWFVLLQVYRFRDTGRACSGDFGTSKFPQLDRSGSIILYYVIAQYTFYILQKILSICITNAFETEFEKKKEMILGKV